MIQPRDLSESSWTRSFPLLFFSLSSSSQHRELPRSVFISLQSRMASPRLETFCCPNRNSATEFVVTFQPVLFGALTLGSAAVSLIFTVLQILPKRKGYRRLGQYPLPRPASSSRILFIISICDILGCTGKKEASELPFFVSLVIFLAWRCALGSIMHPNTFFLTLLLPKIACSFRRTRKTCFLQTNKQHICV